MATRKVRVSTVLDPNPAVGDVQLKIDDANPMNVCVTPGIYKKFGGAAFGDTISFAFLTKTAGETYVGGNYVFGGAADDFNPLVTFGTVNSSHGSKVILIADAGAGGGDTTVRITGTSIVPAGTRTASDFEDLVLDDAGALATLYQTTKSYLGQVTIEKQSGPDLLANYGLMAALGSDEFNYIVSSIYADWLAGANDSGFDLQLVKHEAAGWTFNAGAEPDPPTPIRSLLATHGVEHEAFNGEKGTWQINDLNLLVNRTAGEGLLVRIITTSVNTIFLGQLAVTYVTAS